jgi:phosphatidylglycerophosphate synthase
MDEQPAGASMSAADEVFLLIRGDLSPRARVVTALLPAIVAGGYFVVGLVIFTILMLLRGEVRRDSEMEARGASFLVSSYLRHYFIWALTPLWRLVVATGIPVMAVTTLAALLGLGAGVAVAAGRFALGGWLFLFSGMLDIIDGRLARARNQATSAGAAFDSILDRYTDSAMLLGLAWYFRESWVLFAVLVAFAGTSLVPYIRAKSEALGRPIRSGLMQRPERIVILGGSVALSPIFEALVFPDDARPMHWLAVVSMVFLAVASNATAVRRFVGLLRALGGTASRPGSNSHRTTAAAVGATVLDYGFVTAILAVSHVPLPAATAVGCLVGALVYLSTSRIAAVYGPAEAPPQFRRYALVSLVSALLNGGLVALLSLHFDVHHAWLWWPARALVIVLWNFPVHRDYVFVEESGSSGFAPRS